MSMYDHFTFPYQMPDGTREPEYQTKSLRYQMDMACYEVNACGQLIRTASEYDQPLGVIAYEHTIAISNHHGVYELRFASGTLQEIHCLQTGITASFTPENFV